MPSPKPATVPSVARYQPGARRRRVRVIAAPSQGTGSTGGSRPRTPADSWPAPASRRALSRAPAAARGGLLALLVEPAVELALGDDPHDLAHRGVADPAQRGAHDLVAADLVRREVDVAGAARPGIGLEPELGHPELVHDSPGPDPEVDRPVLGEHELGRAPVLGRVLEGPSELLAGGVHDEFGGLLPLDVVE